jgi:molybdopterin converting factor small subunit
MNPEGPIGVTVKFFGGLRELAGSGSAFVAIPGGSRLSELLARLDGLLPGAAEKLRAGLSQGYVHVLVDGRDVAFLSGEDPLLSEGSSVAFVPPLGGG